MSLDSGLMPGLSKVHMYGTVLSGLRQIVTQDGGDGGVADGCMVA
jgi:hypothetical protein